MANVDSLKAKVREHGLALAAEALVVVQAELDAVVPDSDKSGGNNSRRVFGEKLRDSRVTAPIGLEGDVVRIAIAYTAPHARFTDDGPEPHTIPLGGRAEQTAKGYPLRFMVPSTGEEAFAFEVQWKPGPGVEANKGWFHRGLDVWSAALQAATDSVRT